MLFNSLAFALFFPVVTAGYFTIPHRLRWLWLLAASCFFYMWFIPVYIVILLGTILIDYFAGIGIENSREHRRRWILGLSLAANIGILAVFKYFNFFSANLTSLAHALGWNYSLPLLNFLLPIGLSFHTFQAMSYTIEVYRGTQKAERHLGIYALYVLFYPQLVAGPIERPQNLLPQFHKPHYFDYNGVTSGLRLMAWGLFKKVVIADRLAQIVAPVYDHPSSYAGPWLVLATVAFAFQIFCDFSGYSDIAIGSARTMGFHLMRNFDQPYFANSLSDFWKRWHISLSTWFRDYLYLPLGGNRSGRFRWRGNLLVVFLISGVWHGASWNFIIWGILHGLLLVAGTFLGIQKSKSTDHNGAPKDNPLAAFLQWAITFSSVCVCWVFFRATSFHESLEILGGMLRDWSHFSLADFLAQSGVKGWQLATGICGILLLELVHFAQRRVPLGLWIRSLPLWQRWTLYYALTSIFFLVGVQSNDQFIYFQF